MRDESRASPWSPAIFPPQPARRPKPRSEGLTMVIDKGLGLRETEDLLEMASSYIDYVKLAFGTSFLYPSAVLEYKIAAIKACGLDVYPGGTLYELACVERRIEHFARKAREIGFTALEVSEGTIELSRESRRRMIDAALDAGLNVVTEIGKKDPSVRLEVNQVAEEVAWDLAAGSRLVIIEGRDSGVGVGAYDDNGAPRHGFVDELLRAVDEPGRIMWEAPQGRQQLYWIKRFGPNANLGNVQPADVIPLEAMRQGLRSDTLRDSQAFID